MIWQFSTPVTPGTYLSVCFFMVEGLAKYLHVFMSMMCTRQKGWSMSGSTVKEPVL